VFDLSGESSLVRPAYHKPLLGGAAAGAAAPVSDYEAAASSSLSADAAPSFLWALRSEMMLGYGSVVLQAYDCSMGRGTPHRGGWAVPSDGLTFALQAATLAMGAPDSGDRSRSDLQNFMDRIYFELRSKGASPEERARNFAATQAYFVNNVITYAMGHGLNLQRISVAHSPLCRPGSECWDATLAFFDPENPNQSALKVFRFTVDVSDVKPVMIGPMYTWSSY
jgi:hypothetical protein